MKADSKHIFSLFTRDVLLSLLAGFCFYVLYLFIAALSGPMWMDAQVNWAGGNKVNWGLLPFVQAIGLGLLVTIVAGIFTAMLCSEWVKDSSRIAKLGGLTGLVMALAPWNPTWNIFLALESGSGHYLDIFLLYPLTVVAGIIVLVPVAAASAYCYSRLNPGRLSGLLRKKAIK